MRLERKTTAFGLLELLVSIGIAGILIALLSSGLAGVRGSQQTARCMANLRNLGAAVSAYIADSNGYYPSMLTIKDGKWSNYWPDQLTPYLPNTGAKTSLGYPVKNAAFFCPTQTDHGTWGDYTANPNIMVGIGSSAGKITTALRPAQITNQSSRILIIDGTNGRGYGSFYLDSNFITDPRNSRKLTLTGTLYPPVHRNFMNALFVDGHLEALHIDDLIERRKVLLGGVADIP